MQGLNSGLVLFSLAEMRASSEYNKELARDRMDSLSEAFLPSPDWNLSEQVLDSGHRLSDYLLDSGHRPRCFHIAVFLLVYKNKQINTMHL